MRQCVNACISNQRVLVFGLANIANAVLLNELIEKILVHEAVKGENGESVQEIEIYYRFVGKIE